MSIVVMLCLAAGAKTHSRPIWEFTILASVEGVFVDRFGGLDSCALRIRDQLDSVNSMFNDSGVFDGNLMFVLDSIQEFGGSGFTQAAEPHPEQDYHVVYDFDTQSLSNWLYPPDNAVLFRTFSTDEVPLPFISAGNRLLAHELAHSRGAVDLYGLEVDGRLNEVNSAGYQFETCVMADGVSRHWSDHTIRVINSNAERVLEPSGFRLLAFPREMRLLVVDLHDEPVSGASVQVFGHTWYDMALRDDPLDLGVTDSAGVYVMMPDLFINPVDSDLVCANALCLTHSTLLLQAEYGGRTGYCWLPFTEPQVHWFDGSPDPFVVTIELSITQDSSDVD
ncbi:MAG: hypothetical protein KKA42_10330, partial [candidate division Zixibacteria bacterium]|nr:hypothetical protein [candidate division Zixibacteria bacterium]